MSEFVVDSQNLELQMAFRIAKEDTITYPGSKSLRSDANVGNVNTLYACFAIQQSTELVNSDEKQMADTKTVSTLSL